MNAKQGDAEILALRLLVRGRVQGVGYRYALADEARSRRLRGWVRNRSDGCVEAVVVGSPAEVDAVVSWARRGPAAAQVTAVETAGAEGAEGNYIGFDIAPTL